MPRMPPQSTSEKPHKHTRRLSDIRGPEEVHNSLIYRQFALQALDGGNLKFGHFEMMRLQVNKAMDDRRMFAFWRVDAPWKGMTKRKAGQTLGGGKKAANHYVTPVKRDRIIFEMGGDLHWREAHRIIKKMAHNMPFPARFVSQAMLEEEAAIQKYIDENNINPFTFEKCLEHNLLGCETYTSLHHYDWKKYYP